MNRSEFVATNVRPENYNTKDFNKGDCTTRSMFYALNGEMTYEEIEAEQYRIGKERGTVRNMLGTWDKVLTNRGFEWIQFSNNIVRQRLATYLNDIETPMVTISRGHACAIHKGNVIDTWDSRGGRCYGILVKSCEIGNVIKIIEGIGVECEVVEKPINKMKRSYRRRIPKWYFN
jgi:hypothetical protein